MAFLLTHTKQAAAAVSVVTYLHRFSFDVGSASNTDMVAHYLRGRADPDDELVRIDLVDTEMVRHIRLGHGDPRLGGSEIQLLNIDYWIEAPDHLHVARVCFSSPHGFGWLWCCRHGRAACRGFYGHQSPNSGLHRRIYGTLQEDCPIGIASFTVEMFPFFTPFSALKWEHLDSERYEKGGVRDNQRFLGSRYELINSIGSGAMGRVWRARLRADAGHVEGEPRDLAVKLLRSDLADDPDVVRRFVQERSILMGLKHSSIVQVVDMVAEGDRLAIVMEYVPGGALSKELERLGTLPPSTAVPVACAVLDALDYAHDQGVLHRDVKPANVLLAASGLESPGEVKLSDFGIASFTDEQGAHSTGLVGSPAYMPPELFTTGTVTAASDVYAAGIMLYELLAGRTPFAGAGTAHTVGVRHVTVDPPTLPVHKELWRILEWMLCKQPEDRPAAADAAKALRRLPVAVLNGDALEFVGEPEWDAAGTLLGPSAKISGADSSLGRGDRSGVATDSDRSYPITEDTGATVLGKEAHSIEFVRPVRESRRKPKPWLVALIIALAVGLVAAGVLIAVKAGVFNRPQGAAPTTVPTWMPAHLVGEPYSTGLRVDMDAAPSTTGPQVSLTLVFTAPRSTGLSGDVLLVVPAAAGDECPSLGDSDLQQATASADGVTVNCAYKVPVVLDAGASTIETLEVAGELGGDLTVWLTSIVDKTRQALDGVTGVGFALQRVTGIEVYADSLMRTEAAPQVHYRVVATWNGGEQELFRYDTLAFQATDLLRSLTGGYGLDGVKVESCPETQVRGTSVLAQQSAASCFVQVTIGDLASRQAFFTISNSGR